MNPSPRPALAGLLLSIGLTTSLVAQGQRLTLDGEGPSDLFGRACAGVGDIDQDGFDDIAVGARDFSLLGANIGRAYIYSGRTGNVLCTRDGESAGDAFGVSMAGLGDLNGDSIPEWIVGARTSDTAGTDAGKVFVYSGCNMVPLYTLVGEHPLDRFGWAVAAGGDIDADGFDDFLVGAPRNATVAFEAGKVYAYSGLTGGLLRTYFGEAAGDHFGIALAGTGDVTGDGRGDVLVGAPFHDGATNRTGKAYLFSGLDGALVDTFEGTGFFEELAASVATAGDLNGDGYRELMIGSLNGGPEYQGQLFVYSGIDSSLLYSYSGEEELDAFGGSSLANAGDANGDGFDDFVVGATGFDQPANEAGKTYLYSGQDGRMLSRFEGEKAGDRLGISTTGAGDVDNDGYADIGVGAYLYDATGPDSGRVFVFGGNDLFLTAIPRTAPPGSQLQLHTRGGRGGQPAFLFLTAVNGVPLFTGLIHRTLDATGGWSVGGTVSGNLGGTNLTFQTFALNGAGGIATSEPVTVTFP